LAVATATAAVVVAVQAARSCFGHFSRSCPVGQTNAAVLNTLAGNEQIYNTRQDFVNARRPGRQPLLRQIPGLQLFRRFVLDQIAGLTPGGSPIWYYDQHTDGFHMEAGKIAYIASVMSAACMYGMDPKTFPNTMRIESGFTTAEAIYVENCVSDVVKAFDRSGVDTSA
jgi:hypothetical protein